MTIAIKGNSQGGVVEANGVAAANVSSASGLPFMKNKLINASLWISYFIGFSAEL